MRRSIWQGLLEGSLRDWAVFAGGLLLALGAAWVLTTWRSRWRDDSDPAGSGGELWGRLAEMRRRGDISEAEYRSIKGRLPGGSAVAGSPSLPPCGPVAATPEPRASSEGSAAPEGTVEDSDAAPQVPRGGTTGGP